MDRKSLRLRRRLNTPAPPPVDPSAPVFHGNPFRDEFGNRHADAEAPTIGIISTGDITAGTITANRIPPTPTITVSDSNGGLRFLTFEEFSAQIQAANPSIDSHVTSVLNPADVSPERRARNQVRIPRDRSETRARSPFYSIDYERRQGHVRELEVALLPVERRDNIPPGTLFTPQQAFPQNGSVQSVDTIFEVASAPELTDVYAMHPGATNIRKPSMTEYVYPIESARWVTRTYSYEVIVDKGKPAPERMWRRITNAVAFTIARLLGIKG